LTGELTRVQAGRHRPLDQIKARILTAAICKRQSDRDVKFEPV